MSVKNMVYMSKYDTFKNFESTTSSSTLSGTITAGAIKTQTVTLTNSRGLNVADFYYKKSTDNFYFNGYVSAGTGDITIPVSGGAFVTDIPVEFFLVTANNSTSVTMWMYNSDINTVTLTATTVDFRFILYLSPFA